MPKKSALQAPWPVKWLIIAGLSLCSGLLLAAAYPPFEQGYLAWVALLPLLWVCLQVRPAEAAAAGFLFALPLHLYLNYYLKGVLFTYLPDLLAWAAMAMMVAFISSFYALFAVTASLVSRRARAWFTALAVPAAWVLVEYLRSLTFLGYNVGYLGYSQWQYHFLLNLASVYGYWGLPFVIVSLQVALLLLFTKIGGRPAPVKVVLPFFLVLSIGLLLPLTYREESKGRSLTAALIQGNTRQEMILGDYSEEILGNYLQLSRRALAGETGVDLVVWPETVVTLDHRGGQNHPTRLEEAFDELGVSLLYGARVLAPGYIYNSIVLYDPSLEQAPVYHKHRLVPFVEFFPLDEQLNRLLMLELLIGRYRAGEDITIFRIEGTELAGVICFESYFGDHTRRFAAKGARHMFVLTNDAWFGKTIGLDQHANVGAIRAAEMGIGVTQVANSGLTISFDHRGRELFRSGKATVETFVEPLDLDRRGTIYTRLGDYFPAFWAIFLAGAGLFPWLLGKIQAKTKQPPKAGGRGGRQDGANQLP